MVIPTKSRDTSVDFTVDFRKRRCRKRNKDSRLPVYMLLGLSEEGGARQKRRGGGARGQGAVFQARRGDNNSG